VVGYGLNLSQALAARFILQSQNEFEHHAKVVQYSSANVGFCQFIDKIHRLIVNVLLMPKW
jgi:hypothetical protein